jgi:hypothetical protein
MDASGGWLLLGGFLPKYVFFAVDLAAEPVPSRLNRRRDLH